MKFEKTQLVQIMGCSQATEDKWIGPINKACEKFGIDTKLRLAAFIAQVAHESGRLSAVTENLNYSASGLMSTWPSRFDTFKANAVARNPEKIANAVYCNRMGNGTEASGDGWKFRGRGLIQCTGKSNYDAFSQACGVNAVANPDSLAQPDNAALSAGWFWNSKGLNAYADRGDFITTTKRINGGTIGQADRELLYKRALIVLSGGVPPSDLDLSKKPIEVSPDSTASGSDQKTPAAQNSSIVEPRAANGGGASKYPWNYVRESRSGHITEIDDTPGNERLNMTHRTGTYWEIDKLGTFTHKSILDSYKLTKGDAYDYTGGSYTQQVKGQSFRQSTGDMIFKTDGQMFINANRVQMNTGTLAVSGEVNSPHINANIFSGLGGLAFGDMLAKEALLAYDIVKGKAPMLGQSLGFKGAPGGESGSADGKMTNNLSNQAPDGTPWVTNGIKAATSVVVAGAAVSAIADILKGNDTSNTMTNALNSAAADAAAKAKQDANQTPVFMKHVTFDKPTLMSQSTSLSTPDPELYVNNLHTIVDADGNGQLHISNGKEWIPIGKGVGIDVNDPVIGGIIEGQEINTAAIVKEAQDRANAILAEAQARTNALIAEAQARQNAIEQGLLAEATARGAAVQAESTIRQTEDESLADYILTLTSSMSDDIAAAIQEEKIARSDAISAEATARGVLASKVNDNTASITNEATARTNGDSAIASNLSAYISSNNTALAGVRSELITKVESADTALSTRIDSIFTSNGQNKAMIETEIQSRVDADSALSSRVDTLVAQSGAGASALVQQEATARTNADSALSGRIDVVLAKANDNAGLISTETQARANAVSSLAGRVDVISATANTKAQIFRQGSAPVATTAGDLWFDTANNNRVKIWNGSAWVDTTDTRVTQNSADIVTVSQARADGDTANANAISALSTTVGGHTTSISSNISSINGISANYGIKVNNNGVVAGFGLLSTPVNGNVVSSFIIEADKFAIVKPGAGNNTAQSPFIVDTSTNPPTIYLAGNVKAQSLAVSKYGAGGARTEITDTLIQIFDGNGVLRVRLGVW